MQPHEPGRLGIGINGLGVWKNVWLAARRIHSAQQTDRITRKTLELIGALRATAGQLTFNGTDVTRAARQSRAALGMAYVPQGPTPFRPLARWTTCAWARLKPAR